MTTTTMMWFIPANGIIHALLYEIKTWWRRKFNEGTGEPGDPPLNFFAGGVLTLAPTKHQPSTQSFRFDQRGEVLDRVQTGPLLADAEVSRMRKQAAFVEHLVQMQPTLHVAMTVDERLSARARLTCCFYRTNTLVNAWSFWEAIKI